MDTDSRREATLRALEAIRQLESFWTAKIADKTNGTTRYEALAQLALAKGFSYKPTCEVAALDLNDLLLRIGFATESETTASAVLGAEKTPAVSIVKCNVSA